MNRIQIRYVEAEQMAGQFELTARLGALKMEHRDMDAAIAALGLNPVADQLQLARLKKRKLRLKDEILAVENQMVPDIIA